MYVNKLIGQFHHGVVPFKFFIFTLFLSINSSFVFIGTGNASEHGAHVHGVASLNVVLDETNLIIEFRSPGANIVGFEHAIEDEGQRSAVKEAIEKLQDDKLLFDFPASGQCAVVSMEVHSDQLTQEHHDEHEDEHEDEHNDEHHDEHEDEHHDEHHDEHDMHSDFFGQYQFKCNAPEKMKTIQVNMFSQFSGMEKIEVQLFSTKKQTAFSLTENNNTIELK